MEEILHKILDKLTSMDERLASVENRQDELNKIVSAILQGQEITHTKLEGLSKQVEELQDRIEYHRRRIFKAEEDIHLLKLEKNDD